MAETPFREPIMQFFKFDHLPEKLKGVSAQFCELAETVHEKTPRNPERTVALRKLLEAKDAAVRALLAGPAAMLLFLLLPTLALAQAATAATPVPSPMASALAQFFWQTIFPALLTAIGALVAWALKKLVDLLHEKASTSKAFAAAEKLAMVVQHEVADAEVTLRPAIAKAMEDGKLTAEEATELRLAVIARIKSSAGPALLGVVQSQVAGNLDSFLGGMLERAVGKLSASGVDAPPAPAPEARPTAPSAPSPT